MTYEDKPINLVLNRCTESQYKQAMLCTQISDLSDQLFLVELSGQIDANMSTIISVADPVSQTDAANKRYVDAVSAELQAIASSEYVKNSSVSSIQLSGKYEDGTTFSFNFLAEK